MTIMWIKTQVFWCLQKSTTKSGDIAAKAAAVTAPMGLEKRKANPLPRFVLSWPWLVGEAVLYILSPNSKPKANLPRVDSSSFLL